MNERIKLLADQARKHYPGTELSGEYWVFDEQLFAKLIIKECADWIDRQDETRCPYGVDLVEHFGVR